MKYGFLRAVAARALFALASASTVEAHSKSYCEDYARNMTRHTGTTTGVVRGAARGAVVGSVTGNHHMAATGAAVGATRHVAQKARSYNYYYDRCMHG